MRSRRRVLPILAVVCLCAAASPSFAFKNLLAPDVLEMIEDGDVIVYCASGNRSPLAGGE